MKVFSKGKSSLLESRRVFNSFCIIRNDGWIHVLLWYCCCPNISGEYIYIVFYLEKVSLLLNINCGGSDTVNLFLFRGGGEGTTK